MESPHKRIKLEHPAPSPPAATTPTAPSVPEAKIELEVEPSSTETLDPLPDDQQYQRRYLLRGHKKALSSVKFSPDGKYLASACLHPVWRFY
jgi:COMPASS component SWD3